MMRHEFIQAATIALQASAGYGAHEIRHGLTVADAVCLADKLEEAEIPWDDDPQFDFEDGE